MEQTRMSGNLVARVNDDVLSKRIDPTVLLVRNLAKEQLLFHALLRIISVCTAFEYCSLFWPHPV
jgi:hypothetical protein